MKHFADIKTLVETLQNSQRFHALVIQSAPGWGKSSTIERILTDSGTLFQTLGSYSTPLQLYKALCDSPEATIVIDDCAGLFGNPIAMALLKAACWESAGTNGLRRVAWRSSCEKVAKPFADFEGKLILLANSLPSCPETESFLSRTLYLNITFTKEEISEMLTTAAQNKAHFADERVAKKVVEVLIKKYSTELERINFRTLRMGYELAIASPEKWEALFDKLLPKISPSNLVRSLSESCTSTQEQVKQFMNSTGLSRRTFFNYRSQIRLKQPAT